METLTAMEKGLLKQCGYKKHTIASLISDLDYITKISSKTIGKLGGKQAVLDYRAEIGGRIGAYHLTIIKDYTNKRGKTHKAHFNINGKYMTAATKVYDKPYPVLCYTQISPETIHKWTIEDNDEDFKLVPVKL
tara:strand:- start:1388 stop:1789 length:402 start_codon:yes stop_codon:yes gene_type:complete